MSTLDKKHAHQFPSWSQTIQDNLLENSTKEAAKPDASSTSSRRQFKPSQPPAWVNTADNLLAYPFRLIKSAGSFVSWRLIKLIVSLLLLYFLIHLDANAQTYQQYPISPSRPAVTTGPRYASKADSLIYAQYKQSIIFHRGNVPQKASGNQFIRGIFLRGSRITSIKRAGEFTRIEAVHRRMGKAFYFFPAKYELSFLKVGMIAIDSPAQIAYQQMIARNKAAIADYNDSIKAVYEDGKRSFLSKLINPKDE